MYAMAFSHMSYCVIVSQLTIKHIRPLYKQTLNILDNKSIRWHHCNILHKYSLHSLYNCINLSLFKIVLNGYIYIYIYIFFFLFFFFLFFVKVLSFSCSKDEIGSSYMFVSVGLLWYHIKCRHLSIVYRRWTQIQKLWLIIVYCTLALDGCCCHRVDLSIGTY